MPLTGTNDHTAILSRVSRYYSEKVTRYGACPQGVDWRDGEGQERRFEQLLRSFDLSGRFTIAEIGCGYGALPVYLRRRNLDFRYAGYDVSTEMVRRAQDLHSEAKDVSFHTGVYSEPADYVVASGIFNIRFDVDDAPWSDYAISTMDQMVRLARRGAAFNFLTCFSDSERKETRLWYPDPGQILDLCLARYGRNVALYHDYELYEFTVVVMISRNSA